MSFSAYIFFIVDEREFVDRIRVFFFSSRRRHTRSLRDWSSDVCSSDLPMLSSDTQDRRRVAKRIRTFDPSRLRSEERRVGKECRARLWPYYDNKYLCRFCFYLR